jgi:hypothetical protein
MATTANLGMTLLDEGQAQKEVTINEALQLLDTRLQGLVSANNGKMLYCTLSSGTPIVAPVTIGAGLQFTGGTIAGVDASASVAGMVSTGTQTFAGAKTFNGLVTSGAGFTASSGAIEAGSGSFVSNKARMYVDGTLGTVFTAKSGSSYDIAFASSGGFLLFANPTGTSDFSIVNGEMIVAKRVRSGVVVLTDGATIALNAKEGNHFRVTLGGNRTLNVPTNAQDGQRITLEVIQDATGSRTLTLTTGTSGAFAFGTDITTLTLSTAANAVDTFDFVYSASKARWLLVRQARGF